VRDYDNFIIRRGNENPGPNPDPNPKSPTDSQETTEEDRILNTLLDLSVKNVPKVGDIIYDDITTSWTLQYDVTGDFTQGEGYVFVLVYDASLPINTRLDANEGYDFSEFEVNLPRGSTIQVAKIDGNHIYCIPVMVSHPELLFDEEIRNPALPNKTVNELYNFFVERGELATASRIYFRSIGFHSRYKRDISSQTFYNDDYRRYYINALESEQHTCWCDRDYLELFWTLSPSNVKTVPGVELLGDPPVNQAIYFPPANGYVVMNIPEITLKLDEFRGTNNPALEIFLYTIAHIHDGPVRLFFLKMGDPCYFPLSLHNTIVYLYTPFIIVYVPSNEISMSVSLKDIFPGDFSTKWITDMAAKNDLPVSEQIPDNHSIYRCACYQTIPKIGKTSPENIRRGLKITLDVWKAKEKK